MAEDKAYEKIGPALDRFQEAHFWIHMMENYYHAADPFRWHLNVFLKAIREVPQVLRINLQNEMGFAQWFSERSERLRTDPLLAKLAKRRDFVVHRGMLKPSSTGSIGITELRGLKLGFSFPVYPWEDSDAAMERFLQHLAKHGDFFGFLMDDEDSLPCVRREWRLPEFDGEMVGICAKAWLRLGETIADVLRWLGTEPPPLSLDCRHSEQVVQFKLFSREALKSRLRQLQDDGREHS